MPRLVCLLACLLAFRPSFAAPPEATPRRVEPIASRGCTPLWRVTELKKSPQETARRLGLKRWTLCDPTHEAFLLAVLREAGVVQPTASLTSPEVMPYLRGMLWNDDPQGLLFEGTLPATRPAWLESYRKAQGQARAGRPAASLHARVQFGDLQFIHALKTSHDEPVEEALDDVYRWLQFTWRVAIGELGGEVKLLQVPVPGLAELFPRQADWTIARLLGGDEVRQRALGSFLHTLQDAYDPHHVQRATDDRARAYIRVMGTVADGRHKGHAEAPGWRAGWKNDVVLWEVAPALVEPFHRAVDLAQMANYRRPWAGARAYLEHHVLPRR